MGMRPTPRAVIVALLPQGRRDEVEVEVPHAALAWPLLSFNLGIEAGQVVAISILFPCLVCLRRSGAGRRAVMALSALLLAAGLALLIERVLVATG